MWISLLDFLPPNDQTNFLTRNKLADRIARSSRHARETTFLSHTQFLSYAAYSPCLMPESALKKKKIFIYRYREKRKDSNG